MTHTTQPINITHRLPGSLTDLTFEVTLRDTTREDGTVFVTVNYPAGVDLSGYTVVEAYPIARVEAAVSKSVGLPLMFVGCEEYGTEGDNTYELWVFDPSP